MTLETRVLIDGLVFPESPRWHNGKLWFSDMHAHCVMNINLDAKLDRIVEVPGQPSGLGWLPDGSLLIVSMTDRRLMRFNSDGLSEVADLNKLVSSHCNDMVVDRQGRAYIGDFGFDVVAQEPFAPGEIIMVTPDGNARIVADDLAFPNGMVITPDGQTLIVAETFASRLTAFDLQLDSSLTRRRVWANLDQAVMPDGICLDTEGAIWVASPGSTEVLRVCEGGEVTHRVKTLAPTLACMLGGPDRTTLFVLTAEAFTADETRVKVSGRIETVHVDVPGAGIP